MTAGGLTILRTVGGLLATKRWTWDSGTQCWLKKSYDRAARFLVTEVTGMTGIDDLADVIRHAASDPHRMVIRASLSEAARTRIANNPNSRVTRRKRTRGGVEPDFVEVDRQWLMLDIDSFQLRGVDDLVDAPESAIQHAIEEILPSCFQDVRCFWQLSSSAGFEHGVLKVHLFYWLTEPLIDGDLKRTLKQHAPGITDLTIYQGVQPHYVATPIIEGGPDPIPCRFGWIKGMEDAVSLPRLRHDDPPRPSTGQERKDTRPSSGGNPLELLGDGPGLDGFHLPLRTACWRYAADAHRFGVRDDTAFIETIRAAIEAAPKRTDRDVTAYDEIYLQRSIEGAFAGFTGQEGSGGDAPEPSTKPNRPTLDEARAALVEAVGGFFAAEREWTDLNDAAMKTADADD
jgi:hypothetical protein